MEQDSEQRRTKSGHLLEYANCQINTPHDRKSVWTYLIRNNMYTCLPIPTYKVRYMWNYSKEHISHYLSPGTRNRLHTMWNKGCSRQEWMGIKLWAQICTVTLHAIPQTWSIDNNKQLMVSNMSKLRTHSFILIHHVVEGQQHEQKTPETGYTLFPMKAHMPKIIFSNSRPGWGMISSDTKIVKWNILKEENGWIYWQIALFYGYGTVSIFI